MRTKKPKTLAQFEKERDAKNKRQREYRRENPELYDLWKQRSYANYLRKKGWKVTEPEGLQTPEELRQSLIILRQLGPDLPILDPDELNINPDDLPW